MKIDSADILKSITWTFENRIVPSLPQSDELAQSYARTLSFMLEQLAERIEHEQKVLIEEWLDLTRLMTTLRPRLDEIIQTDLERTLADNNLTELIEKGTLKDKVAEFRRQAVTAIQHLPDGQRTEIRQYLSRQLERDGRYLNIPLTSTPF